MSEPWAGYQYYAVNLTRALARSLVPELTLFSTGDRENLPADLRDGNRCLQLAKPANSRVLTEQVCLPWNLSSGVDRLLVPAYLGPLCTSVPTDLILYDLAFLRKFSGLSLKQQLYWRGLYRLAFRRAARIFPCSSTTARRFKNMFPSLADKLGPVLYPGVKSCFTGPRKISTDTRPAELQPYILFVGTISPRKNVERLVEWYLTQSAVNERYNLVLVGDFGWGGFGPDSLAQPRNGIYWFQGVRDSTLVDFYQNAKVLVLPSREEGFGMPVLEAFSQSLPVVLTEIPVFREVAGEAAFYLEPDSTTDWTTTFLRALENEQVRRQSIVRGRRRLQQFSWATTARKYLRAIC